MDMLGHLRSIRAVPLALLDLKLTQLLWRCARLPRFNKLFLFKKMKIGKGLAEETATCCDKGHNVGRYT